MSDKPLDCVGTTGGVGKHDFRPSPTEPIIHGVGQVPVMSLAEELAAVTRERDALANVLVRIEVSDLPDGSLATPNVQLFAAETLAALASGELRKP